MDKRAVFYAARKQGINISASARMAKVSRATGERWERLSKSGLAEQEARRAVIATKTDAAKVLSDIVTDSQVAPRDRVNAVATLSKVMGYDAPTRSEQVIVHASVAQWIEAQRQAAMPATPTPPSLPAHATQPLRIGDGAKVANATGGEPPIEARAESVSQSPNISKKSEKE